MVTVTGSHSKTFAFGVLFLDGKQLFRQYESFDSYSFIAYLEDVKKKFRKSSYLQIGQPSIGPKW